MNRETDRECSIFLPVPALYLWVNFRLLHTHLAPSPRPLAPESLALSSAGSNLGGFLRAQLVSKTTGVIN